MESKFSLEKQGDFYLLKKLTYPHLKVNLDLSKPIPEIKDIIFDEDCSPSEMKKAIDEMEIFLYDLESDEWKDYWTEG